MIRRKLLLENGILYPEMCIYEDNPMVFLYPFYVKSFMKTDGVGYYHHEEHESVTRSGISPRFFDRMYTAEHGLKYGLELCRNTEEQDVLKEKFSKLYFINTAAFIVGRDPLKNFTKALKVARSYRKLIKVYGLDTMPVTHVSGSLKYKTALWVVWLMSYFIPPDPEFFEAQRIAAWGQKFCWDRIGPEQ